MANDKKRSGRDLRPESPREVSTVQMADVVGFYDDGANPVIQAVPSGVIPAAYVADNAAQPVYVGDFKQLCLYCNYDKQGSTRAYLKIKAAFAEAGPYYDLRALGSLAGGTIDLEEFEYQIDDGGLFVLEQPNSGFAWIKVFTRVQGNVTNTSFEVLVARGWGN